MNSTMANDTTATTATAKNQSSSSLSNKLLQMINDDEIMKRKLMIDGDGIGDDRKISNLIKQFLLWCYNNDNESELESELSAERLLMAIDQSELAMAKSVQTIKMITNELDNYENIYKSIEKAINDAREKLFTCKVELAHAKQLRRYKLDYDQLAQIIEKHPSTHETQIKLNVLETQIQTLQNINNQIEQKLEKRRRQFQLLLSASHQLQNVLDEENIQNLNQNNDQCLINDNNQNDLDTATILPTLKTTTEIKDSEPVKKEKDSGEKTPEPMETN